MVKYEWKRLLFFVAGIGCGTWGSIGIAFNLPPVPISCDVEQISQDDIACDSNALCCATSLSTHFTVLLLCADGKHYSLFDGARRFCYCHGTSNCDNAIEKSVNPGSILRPFYYEMYGKKEEATFFLQEMMNRTHFFQQNNIVLFSSTEYKSVLAFSCIVTIVGCFLACCPFISNRCKRQYHRVEQEMH
jgi:hypothetical protein